MIMVESKAMHVLNFVSLTVTTLNLLYSINNKVDRPNKYITIVVYKYGHQVASPKTQYQVPLTTCS